MHESCIGGKFDEDDDNIITPHPHSRTYVKSLSSPCPCSRHSLLRLGLTVDLEQAILTERAIWCNISKIYHYIREHTYS
jgi:hypothetical protein